MNTITPICPRHGARMPVPSEVREYRLKRGLRIVRTRQGWNIWDSIAGDWVRYTPVSSLGELLEWIGDDPMLVTEIN